MPQNAKMVQTVPPKVRGVCVCVWGGGGGGGGGGRGSLPWPPSACEGDPKEC